MTGAFRAARPSVASGGKASRGVDLLRKLLAVLTAFCAAMDMHLTRVITQFVVESPLVRRIEVWRRHIKHADPIHPYRRLSQCTQGHQNDSGSKGEEIAARYAEWEITGPAEIRHVDPDARAFSPHRPTVGKLGPLLRIAEPRRRIPRRVPIAGVAS